MVKKKRHHYIPRFYLKKFAADADGRLIGLYNHKNDVFIKTASLRDQAYKNFLYGDDDEIENILADLEGRIAQMFYYWTEEKLLYPPPADSNGMKLLKRFVLYQMFRTPKMGRDLLDNINDITKKMFEKFYPEKWKKIEGYRIENKDIVLSGLLQAANKTYLLNYLECKLVINLSELPLITSDSPVLLYNQLMEEAGEYTGATGLAVKGLQIFFPVHPRLLLCFFDPQVYECDKASINFTSTESVADIYQLNALQYINSDEQLFFNDVFLKGYFQKLKEGYAEYRTVNSGKNQALEIGGKKLMFLASEDPKIDLKLTFFKTIVDPRSYKSIELRHPDFYER